MKRTICFGLWMALTAFFLLSCGRKSVLLTDERQETLGEGSLPGAGEDSRDLLLSESESSKALIVVHICGYVMEPGVYETEEGSRVYQIIELAGGFAPGAAEGYLNLAETVSDGQKLVVPSLEEAGEDRYGLSPSESESSLVNINTADRDRLMSLPGIGESKALAIIAWRTEHGAFETIEDIMQVSGIKESAYEKIKLLITVE